MGCVPCLDGTTGRAGEDQDANGARLSQNRATQKTAWDIMWGNWGGERTRKFGQYLPSAVVEPGCSPQAFDCLALLHNGIRSKSVQQSQRVKIGRVKLACCIRVDVVHQRSG